MCCPAVASSRPFVFHHTEAVFSVNCSGSSDGADLLLAHQSILSVLESELKVFIALMQGLKKGLSLPSNPVFCSNHYC